VKLIAEAQMAARRLAGEQDLARARSLAARLNELDTEQHAVARELGLARCSTH